MRSQSLMKSTILLVVVVASTVLCWELYWRSHGYEISYDDTPSMWADKRKRVYEPSESSTVFIGGSRIKYDIDINTWQQITGQHAIQLGCVGSTPLPVLVNLADDSKFKGRLVIDVTETLFFSPSDAQRPKEGIKYYDEETPAQWASFHVNHLLESQFVFLDKESLSLGAILDHLPLQNRPGVFHFAGFPPEFERMSFERQQNMTNRFSADTAQRNTVIKIWKMFDSDTSFRPTNGKKLDSIFNLVKTSIDKIKARGGDVIFVRPPSTGSYLARENKYYPRALYWDKLLQITGCPGIHYQDYPSISNLNCPEESHLDLAGAKIFTTHLIDLLKEKGWVFSYSK
ncbi:MAG TPA: hypothetical protein DGG95_15955 [Cytophagales bacterium]|jgi:hypothetical protein|nr:hypothetical protein [Cytophagales bacterium]